MRDYHNWEAAVAVVRKASTTSRDHTDDCFYILEIVSRLKSSSNFVFYPVSSVLCPQCVPVQVQYSTVESGEQAGKKIQICFNYFYKYALYLHKQYELCLLYRYVLPCLTQKSKGTSSSRRST